MRGIINEVERRSKSMEIITIKGRGITGGIGEGEALVTNQPFGFSHGIEPRTGRISDEKHEWIGKNVKKRVLVFSYGKGSSSGGLYLLEAVKEGNAPAAVVTFDIDPVMAAGFIMAELLYEKKIPVVDKPERNPFEIIRNGNWVKVDGDSGTIEISTRGTGSTCGIEGNDS